MPRFAANLSMMFNEVPFLDRFTLARAAGFTAVEFMFPYEFTSIEIKRRLDDNGLELALFNAPAGNWGAGDRGCTALPGRSPEFKSGVMLALEYANALACPRLHLMAGLKPNQASHETYFTTYVNNLQWACEECVAAGIKAVIEPINHRDIPNYFLNTTSQAVSIIDAIGINNLGLQFDLYHAQVTEGDLVNLMTRLMPYIAHMQVADNPGRNEPGTGEINWTFVFRKIDELGFDGWIGCEYRPKGKTEVGLTWFQSYK